MSFENKLKQQRRAFDEIQTMREQLKNQSALVRDLSKDNRRLAQEISKRLDRYAELVK